MRQSQEVLPQPGCFSLRKPPVKHWALQRRASRQEGQQELRIPSPRASSTDHRLKKDALGRMGASILRPECSQNRASHGKRSPALKALRQQRLASPTDATTHCDPSASCPRPTVGPGPSHRGPQGTAAFVRDPLLRR